ncbi:lactococcin 972 family bacteriocin [Nocardiopsis mwathae]|uniref:Lactococcin 972 family bacteriocin n=1 Tax=Nocardiopsis mwathae TaxID=1472723 RepID=A0A7W9YMT3_9ACTN|nr:lactococcin 972 family bacteriocin [Nocardiopsis mwathae]MBB6174869.1 lactococcin 972 family bacteriocin [Nocardiopsis mwathae]
MNSAKRISIAVLMAAGIVVGTAGAAAAIEKVGGGKWDHGVSGLPRSGPVWSNYYHPSTCHGSTAVGVTTVRASARQGLWSNATTLRAAGNNQTYWRNSC